jgi:hypothetical protein
MTNAENCKFSYYYKDKKTADVEIKNRVVKTIPYTDNFLDLLFGKVLDKLADRNVINYFREKLCT